MPSVPRVKGPRNLQRLPSTSQGYARNASPEDDNKFPELARTSTSESTASTSSSSSTGSSISLTFEPCAWYEIEECECCVYDCTLRRNPHIRRQRRRKLPIKPLPKPPGSSLPTPISRMVLAVEGRSLLRIRKLPPVPPRPIIDFPTVSPTTCSTPIPHVEDYPDSPDDGEIDWEILINEIVNGRLSMLQ
ncbi:hypothetical protein Moror_1066 [Moniliophthora roreri MCA 2997]|uniref:Uncharacterized protein n=2 Tax=Moniliophthora roreri TaxID=221103 RepID=V2XLQ6_MONRO|nr:hypothetical protein Moror_1066 [Moniliophthora roreri MCA 2997]KAI3596677.1 hypothetical protein WG66_016369 [Moniliophthora roreri]